MPYIKIDNVNVDRVKGGINGSFWLQAADLDPSHINIYTAARSNAMSLTCCVRPGIKPASLWILVGIVNH